MVVHPFICLTWATGEAFIIRLSNLKLRFFIYMFPLKTSACSFGHLNLRFTLYFTSHHFYLLIWWFSWMKAWWIGSRISLYQELMLSLVSRSTLHSNVGTLQSHWTPDSPLHVLRGPLSPSYTLSSPYFLYSIQHSLQFNFCFFTINFLTSHISFMKTDARMRS